MTVAFVLLLHIAAYLIGAVPSSVWFGRIFYKKDVRNYGSGNAGATNTFRVLGAGAGFIVLILDIVKGAAAVLLAEFLPEAFTPVQKTTLQLTLGLSAAIGHIYPVYLRFKGGKGVATFFGVVLVIFPMAALMCVAAFIFSFALSRFVSLSSMIASVVFSITIFSTDVRAGQIPVMLFAVCVSLIIVYTHRQNIIRLMSGTESKFSLTKKSEQQ